MRIYRHTGSSYLGAAVLNMHSSSHVLFPCPQKMLFGWEEG